MAKGDKGKIRFIMFEVEGGDDTLAQGMSAMSAMANALSRISAPPRPAAPPPPSLSGNGNGTLNGQLAMNIPEEDTDAEPDVVVSPAPKKPAQERKYYTPKVLKDVDLTVSNVPFQTYCNQKSPKATIQKYMVIALWFKEYRDTPIITQDHIYTCFRMMSWSNLKDFGAPFRDACRAKAGYGSMKKEGFEINHVGENVVHKLGSGS